jgi:hypothetical protein
MNEELILQEIKEMHEDITAIKHALYETNGAAGMCTRLRMVENSVGVMKRLFWLIAGGAITIGTTLVAINVFGIKL